MVSTIQRDGGKQQFSSLHQRMLENHHAATKITNHDNVTELIQSIKQSIEADQSRSKSQFRASTKGTRLAEQFKNQEPSPQYRKKKAGHFASKRTSAMNNSQQQQLPATFRATDALRSSKMNIQTKKGMVYVSQNGVSGFSAAANEVLMTQGAVFTARRKTEKVHHNNLKSQREAVTTMGQDSLIPAQIHNRGTIPIQTGRDMRRSQQSMTVQKVPQYAAPQISGRGVVPPQNNNVPQVEPISRCHQMQQPHSNHQNKRTIEKQQQSEALLEITGAASKPIGAKKQATKFNAAGQKASLAKRDSIDLSSRDRNNILSQSVAGSPTRTKNYFQAVQRVRFPHAHPVQKNVSSPHRISPHRESLQTQNDEVDNEHNSRQQTKYQSMPGLVVEPVTTARSIQLGKGTYAEQASRYGSNIRGLNAEKINSLKIQLKNAEQNSQLSVGGDAIWPKAKGNKLKELGSISEAKHKVNSNEYLQDIFEGKQKHKKGGSREHSIVKHTSIERKTVEEDKFVETLPSNGFNHTIESAPGNEQTSLQNGSISMNKLAVKNKRFGLNGAKTTVGAKQKGARRSNVNSISITESNSILVATRQKKTGETSGSTEVEQSSSSKAQHSFSRRFQSQGSIIKSHQEGKATTARNKAIAQSYNEAGEVNQTVNSTDSVSMHQQSPGLQRQKTGGASALSISGVQGSRFAKGTAQTSKGKPGTNHTKQKSSESLVINQLVRQMLVSKNRHREGSAENERAPKYAKKGEDYRSNTSREREIAAAESDKVMNGSILPQIVEVHKKKLQLDTSKVSGQPGSKSTKSHRQLSTSNKRNITAYLEDYSNVKDHMVSGEYNNNPSSSQKHQMFVSSGQSQERRQSPLQVENNQIIFRMSQGTSLKHNRFPSKDYKETIGSNTSISRQQHAHTILDEPALPTAGDVLDQKRSSYFDLQQPSSIRNVRQTSQDPKMGESKKQATLDSLLLAPRWTKQGDRSVNQVYGSSQETISIRRAANSNSLSQQKSKSRHDAQLDHGSNSFRKSQKKTQDLGKNNQSFSSNQAHVASYKYTFAVENPRKNISGRSSIQFMSEVPKNLSVIKSQGPNKATQLKNIISKKHNNQSITSNKNIGKQAQQQQSPQRRGSVPHKRQGSGRLFVSNKSPQTQRSLKGPQISMVENSQDQDAATRNIVVAGEALAVIKQETSEFYKYSQYSSRQVRKVSTSNKDLLDALLSKSPSGKVQHESPIPIKLVNASKRKRRVGNQSEKSQRSQGSAASSQRGNLSAHSKSNSASSNYHRRRATLNIDLKNPYSDLTVAKNQKKKDSPSLDEQSNFSQRSKNGLKVICVDQNALSIGEISEKDKEISLSSRMRDLKSKVQEKNLRRARRASMYQKRSNSNLSSGSIPPYSVHQSFGGDSQRNSQSKKQLSANSKVASKCSPKLSRATHHSRVSQSRNSQRTAGSKLLPHTSLSVHLRISSFTEQRIREVEAQRNVMQTAPTPSQPVHSLSKKSFSKTVDQDNKSEALQFSFGQDDELASVVKSINNTVVELDQKHRGPLLPGIDNHYSAKKGFQRYQNGSHHSNRDIDGPVVFADRNGSPVFNSRAVDSSIALLGDAADKSTAKQDASPIQTSAARVATFGGLENSRSSSRQYQPQQIKSLQLGNSPSLLDLQKQQYSGANQSFSPSTQNPQKQESSVNLDELFNSLNLSYFSHASQDLVLLPDFKLGPLPLKGEIQPTKFPIQTRLQLRFEKPVLERFNF